ncbi:hypothetical protein ACFCYN_03885 [Gottfriedia sp. NPDC056225]|uniref:hypothetical protein n=1 Tax=Gottfriedia sp. NPDC056225 TaxID=3345751 RepID=UPI0035E2EC09
MKTSLRRILIFPCLCSISFYLGSELVGKTEASFSSTFHLDNVEISAAYVFPATIKSLDKDAVKLRDNAFQQYDKIINTSSKGSIDELTASLENISLSEDELNTNLESLSSIKEVMLKYYNLMPEDEHSYDYVLQGNKQVQNTYKEVESKIDFEKIASIKLNIKEQIMVLENQEANTENSKQNKEDLKNQKTTGTNTVDSKAKDEVTENEKQTIKNSNK